METSGNGWPASPDSDAIGAVAFTIKGVDFGVVKGGDVHAVLSYVADQVAERVEMPSAGQCGGWSYRANVNNPSSLSNHSSATAIDYNSLRHPNAVATTSTWTSVQIDEIHAILAEVGGVVRWGGDYNYTPDAMHFEINVGPDRLAQAATNLGEGGGTGDPGGGTGGAGTTLGADDWADAPLLEYGTRSAATPSTNLSTEDDPNPGAANAEHGYKTAWWKVAIPADHDPQTPVRFDAQLSTAIDPALYEDIRVSLAVHRDVPADEITASEIAFSSGRGDTRPFWDLGDADALVDPGTSVYVQLNMQSDWPEVNYVLRVGDLGPDHEYTAWRTPDVEPVVFTRKYDSEDYPVEEPMVELLAEFGPYEPDDAGVERNHERIPTNNFAAQGPFRAGSFESIICPPIFFEAQAEFPLKVEQNSNMIVETTGGTFEGSSGTDHNYDDNAPNGGLVYPEGRYTYSNSFGTVWSVGYSYGMHPYSYGYAGIGDSINASTRSSMQAWACDPPYGQILHTGDEGLIEYYSLQRWSPIEHGDSGPSPDWRVEKQPGTASVLPRVEMIAYWRIPLHGFDQTPLHAEPRDRVVFAFLEGMVDDTGMRSPYTFTDMTHSMKVFAAFPMLVNDSISAPYEPEFRYERVRMPDNWRPNRDDLIVTGLSVAFAGPVNEYTVKRMPGMDLPYGLPLDNLWPWRGYPPASWEAGPEVNDLSADSGAEVTFLFEYQYQGPTYRWALDLPRYTVEHGGGVLTAEFTYVTQDNGFITDFDASLSASSGTIVSYIWDWGDPLVDDQPFEGMKVPHFYRVAPKTYMVTLTVTDEAGASASVTHAVDVPGPEIEGAYLGGDVAFSG